MAPSRGRGKVKVANVPSTSTRRSTRATRDATVPEVYQDLLAEASATESADAYSERPLKKRRIGGNRPVNHGVASKSNDSNLRVQQTVDDSSESAKEEEDDDESDLAFEDVDLNNFDTAVAPATEDEDEVDEAIQDISISVDAAAETPKRRTQANRTKPISATEKAFRILVHKAHILCLLGHCMYVNGRCNNETVQRHLRSKLSKKTMSYLNPRMDESQFQRNRSFMDGLQQASDVWRGIFTVTGGGMRKARWPSAEGGGEGNEQVADSDMADRAEFVKAANEMQGSQDIGNQLFCAMLRSVGVEARLVCSLQVLPFNNASAKGSTPQKSAKPRFYAPSHTADAANSDSNTSDPTVQTSSSIGKVPSVRRRLGQPSFITEPPITSTPTKKRIARPKLTYPIFWTEAFNTAQQKWIPVDPIVTQTVAKPSKLEPPSSYELNQLSYVIAFEADGVARDVTRRYTKAYNAKTRRMRIEGADPKDGATWLKRALRIFRQKGRKLDREQLEDAELAQREAREGMPANVQDFKGHPVYALERHLRRHEVISPRREVGKVNAGTAAKPRMEAVFRRGDVKTVRSAEKWYRFGQVVREAEVGVKSVPARRGPGDRKEVDGDLFGEDGEGDREMMDLYTEAQTEPYIPPPILADGRVPKNAFGNLDIYVPSMVPARGVHIRHPLTQHAAKLLGISYADAVTGFSFKGRHGTAVIEGAVVAMQFEDAVRTIIDSLEEEKLEETSRERSALALRVWRRLLLGLRVKERVKAYGDGAEAAEEDDSLGISDVEADHEIGADEEDLPTAGLYTLEELLAPTPKPSGRSKRKKKASDEESEEATSSFEIEDEDEEFEYATRSRRANRRVVDEDSEDEYMPDANSTGLRNAEYEGGGFLPEDSGRIEEYGGGYLPDNLVDGLGNSEHISEYGGGFLPDHDADVDRHGGGFLPEDDADGYAYGSGFLPDDEHDIAALKATNGSDSGNVLDNSNERANDKPSQEQTAATEVENDVEEDIMEMGSHDVDAQNHAEQPCTRLRSNGPDLPRTQISDVANKAVTHTANPEEDVIDDAHQTNDAVEDALSDHGSMLSHDPDDEDAEPDWLESDSD